MTRQTHAEDYSVRFISNGYVVVFGQDISRGVIPKEHFCSTPAELGKFISGRVQAIEAERKAELLKRLEGGL
jgi:hypothetical protein